MESDWKLSIRIFERPIHQAIHNHYKVITLTQLSQSACEFGYSEFRSKLSVPHKRSPSRNRSFLVRDTAKEAN